VPATRTTGDRFTADHEGRFHLGTEEVVDRLGTWLASHSSAFLAHVCFAGENSLRVIAALGERIRFSGSVTLGLVLRPDLLRA
jgi:hypothetical protein